MRSCRVKRIATNCDCGSTTKTGPVFFEIKRRVNLVILKQRASVKREHVAALLNGAPPDRRYLVRPDDPKHLKSLTNFCELRDRIQAQPAAYTSYMREGYEKHGDNAVRVTFDRELRAGKFRGELSVADIDSWDRPHMGGVVLELKFTESVSRLDADAGPTVQPVANWIRQILQVRVAGPHTRL